MRNKIHRPDKGDHKPDIEGRGGGVYTGECSDTGRDLLRTVLARDDILEISYVGAGYGLGAGDPEGRGGR